MNYDRLYDTGCVVRQFVTSPPQPKLPEYGYMRGTGVEPVSLSAPDPKSRPPRSGPSQPPLAPLNPGPSATKRHPSLSVATRTTTDCTTWADCSERYPFGVWSLLIPASLVILACAAGKAILWAVGQ